MKRGSQLKNLDLELTRFQTRLKVGAVFVLLLAGVLLGRLFYVQVLQHQHYHMLAESNRIAMVPVVPNRGLIVDRYEQVLAENFSAYTVEIMVAKISSLETTLADIGRLIEITPGQVRRFKKLLAESHEFEAVPLKSKLTDEEVAILAANRYRLPGVEVKSRLFRNYQAGPGMAHVVGFIGRINDADLKRLRGDGRFENYKGGSHIGKVGLEQSYEKLLHGRTGFEQMEMDASGRAVRVLSRISPVSGSDLKLYLDAKLQEVAEHAFGDFRGGLVALDPKTGGVLALVSRPGFDPNLFVDGIDPEAWKELNESPTHPMVNRALRGLYPPGSTIKPFMALAGLELGARTPSASISDPGYYTLPGSSHHYRDWKKDGHGTVDMHKAIVQSCDTYFYRLAVDMGIDRTHDFLAKFGFGSLSGIDLQGESSGLLPSQDWKTRRWNKPWYMGETVIAGIGQGYHQTTPLQLATATATLANGGRRVEPRLVQAIRDPVTRQWLPQSVVLREQLALQPAHLELVRQAMIDVLKPGGTASAAAAGASYLIAGKTGTAQVVGIKQNAKYDARHMLQQHRDHALFIAYAPADAPTIALAVLVENGGHGGTTAAPIARAVFDYYLLGKRPKTMDKPTINNEAANEPAAD
ncbi:MAG: penicillin-binding protein 2 [Thiobacillaceae bacterium]